MQTETPKRRLTSPTIDVLLAEAEKALAVQKKEEIDISDIAIVFSWTSLGGPKFPVDQVCNLRERLQTLLDNDLGPKIQQHKDRVAERQRHVEELKAEKEHREAKKSK